MSSRAATIPPSCVHEVYRSVDAWERDTGRPVIRLHVGEPHFGPPQEVVEALSAAARDGRTGYTSAEGMPELREALTAKLEVRNGHRTSPDLVFATPGSSQGLAALMQSIAEPGDRILLPALHWPIYLQQALLAGLRPVFYPLDDRHHPDLAALSELDGDVLVVNSPANPTGAVCSTSELKALLALAHRRNWQVISDEAYEDFVHDGTHTSLASLERDLAPDERRVFSAFSFSKSYGMTGYRLGYVVTPNRRRAAALRTVQEASIVSPPTPVQYAGIAALDTPDAVRHNADAVRRARSLLAPLVPELPAGGWYALLDVHMDADVFARKLLETGGVSVAPARGFALRPSVSPAGEIGAVSSDATACSLVRLAFCGDHDALAAAVSVLGEALR